MLLQPNLISSRISFSENEREKERASRTFGDNRVAIKIARQPAAEATEEKEEEACTIGRTAVNMDREGKRGNVVVEEQLIVATKNKS